MKKRYTICTMIETHTLINEKIRLYEVLKKFYPDFSKSKLKKILNQRRVMRNTFLETEDVELEKNEKISLLKKPNFVMDLLIYYEDADLIVLEKPPFILSVDADHNPGSSVHATLKKRYGAVFPVHRLDRETTGVMAFALSREAKESFRKQFESKTVERQYVAILHGIPKEKSGVWRSHIKESFDMKMVVDDEGVEAITHFSVKKGIKGRYSYVKCQLETGRKNQIRIHASAAGHPLLGDSRYGSDKKGSTLFLHAHTLKFTHPRSGKTMSFISPIPKEFFNIMN